MQYYEQLGLSREPFSNSPDPEFLYYSSQHIACLQELEIAVRLRRGLNVVIGEVGTGKTTLIRRFIKNMSTDNSMRLHLVLDPYFKSPHAFLRMLCAQVLGEMPDRRLNTFALKEILKKELYRRGVERDLASVLIVDEGQKMTPACLEVLRELLNYETNNKKLLQILLFGQNELGPILKGMENLQDRINSYMTLRPMNLKETRAMIDYRLALSTPMGEDTPRLFSGFAYYAIYRATKGFPRKTVRLCHKIILGLIVRKKKRADMGFVRTVVQEEICTGYQSRPLAIASAFAVLLLAIGLLSVRYIPEVRSMAQGIESVVASQFASKPDGPSPFAPVQAVTIQEEKAGTLEVEPEAVSESMTLDEYFDENDEGAAISESVESSEPQAKENLASNESSGVNVDDAAVALGVVKPAVDMTMVKPEPKVQAETTKAVKAEKAVKDIKAVKEKPVTSHSASLESSHMLDNVKPAKSGEMYETPVEMGKLPVMPQESLSVIIRKVYGVYDETNLRKVIAANPSLKNVNDIVVGQPLVFPVIKPGTRGLARTLCWVRLSVDRSLDKAYGRLRTATNFGFDSRLLPYVAADGALAFAVVLERPFSSKEEAEIERGCLPLALQKDSGVMLTPNPDVSLGQMNELAVNVLHAQFSK